MGIGGIQRTLIDRDPQNLPVPVGGMTPVRIHRARGHRPVGVSIAPIAMGAGFAAAAAGAALLLFQAPVQVSLLGGHVQVGSMVLSQISSSSAGMSVYGGDASYALFEPGDGSARAAASWASDRGVWSGLCRMRAQGGLRVEECSFHTPTGTVTSVDVLDPAVASGWQRTYGDGVRVRIAIPPDGAAVPVPFPVGR
jgi:hypothetical protein